MSYNKVILLGRLGKDPDMRYTPAGKPVCTFSLATSDRWTDESGERKEATVWHNVVAWGKQAETIKEYMTKGSSIFIEGRISNRMYTDKNGVEKYISEVVVTSFQFVGDRVGKTTEPDTSEPSEPPNRQEGGDDELPF